MLLSKSSVVQGGQRKALSPLCGDGTHAAIRTLSVCSRVPAHAAEAQEVCSSNCQRAHLMFATSGRKYAEAVRVQASSVDVKQPTPVVRIDNLSDNFATIVSVQYGDKLGELLETVTALKNMSLNIRKAKVGSTDETRFFVTEAVTSEKVLKSSRLEEIRMTVLNTLVETFPESASSLSAAMPSGNVEPKFLGKREVVPTTIEVVDAPNGAASILKINTQDRPGLLVDIVRVLKDINLNVVSAEVDTVGSKAQDEFFVTYHGEPLNGPMVLLVTNALQYYLSLGELATEESY